MDGQLDLPLHGPSVNIVRKCGPALSTVLQSKFGCVAIISGVDFEGDLTAQQKRPTIVPEKRFSATLHSGVKVSVWKGDLTNFRADAVVNAANASLQHYGGLAAALSQAGGPQIQKESDDYIRQKGNLNTGDAIVSDAGLLPCGKIIHAVGPQLSRVSSSHEILDAEHLLKRAIVSILNRVQEHHLKTVAIPAISSGLFHFPLPLCAKTIVSTVKNYYEYNPPQVYYPEEILLVNNDEPSVQEMEWACQSILTFQKPMMYSQAAAAKTSGPTVQIGKVLLMLIRGKIEEQQADVIVNTASSDRNLKNGQISSALLQKAGAALQKEIYSASRQGQMIITKGYSLPCKEVYHTFCTDKLKEAPQQVLYKTVCECLHVAATNKHKSIAFPAIGTGFLFNKRDAAKIMSDAVQSFAQKCSTTMEVHFVIFDKDAFKAFQEQMTTLQLKASGPSFTQSLEHRDEFRESKPATPQISLRGPSDETTRAAERWLSGLLHSSGTITIRNNFILHFGKHDYLQLSSLSKHGVLIEETFKKGHAEITITGMHEDAVLACLKVEAMLWGIQTEFVKEEESSMSLISSKNVSFERKTVDRDSTAFSDKSSVFKKERLSLLKMETVENLSLETLFNLKKKQLHGCRSQRMLQRIPAQFCDMVSHIGFHAEYAPPADPAYGEGIYFAGTIEMAMRVWEKQDEEYLYFVEAEVLTGNSVPGKPGLILPPAVGTDPLIMYDSVKGGADISVIFSSYQAMPKYIFTCKVI